MKIESTETEKALEQEIAVKANKAPRVTLDDLNDNVVDVEIVKHVTRTGKILRWAVITTKSGFSVTGKPSASVCAENDNEEIGYNIAVANARDELWALMGYALAEKLSAESLLLD